MDEKIKDLNQKVEKLKKEIEELKLEVKKWLFTAYLLNGLMAGKDLNELLKQWNKHIEDPFFRMPLLKEKLEEKVEEEQKEN